MATSQVSFKASKADYLIAGEIAARAIRYAKQAGIKGVRKQTVFMDLVATHANGCPLRLGDLLKADDFNFTHDVFGIRRHLDRRTGRLGGHFLPRFAERR